MLVSSLSPCPTLKNGTGREREKDKERGRGRVIEIYRKRETERIRAVKRNRVHEAKGVAYVANTKA